MLRSPFISYRVAACLAAFAVVVVGSAALPPGAYASISDLTGARPAEAHAPVVPSDTTESDDGTPQTSVLSDPFVRTNGAEGLNLLYNMHFEEARAIFNEIDARYPNHPVGPFLKGLNIWWEILLDLTDTSHDEAFFDAMDETIERSEAILDEDPDDFDATFFKGAALGFRGRLRSNRGNWFKAALDGKKAISYVREVAQQAPENDDYVFGKGMYDYYAAIIPDEYPVSKAIMWMMPDGDKERGLKLLKRSANEGHYIQTEATYFLAQIYFLYENDYAMALDYVQRLRQMHPRNPYFHNFEGRVLARWGRWSRSREVFTEVVARHDSSAAGYNTHMAEVARYYLARERILRQDYDGALQHLAALEGLTSREGVDDTRYRVLGYLYQGMAYDAQGRRDMAVNRYKMVFRYDDYAGAHDRAERYLDDPYGQ